MERICFLSRYFGEILLEKKIIVEWKLYFLNWNEIFRFLYYFRLRNLSVMLWWYNFKILNCVLILLLSYVIKVVLVLLK